MSSRQDVVGLRDRQCTPKAIHIHLQRGEVEDKLNTKCSGPDVICWSEAKGKGP